MKLENQVCTLEQAKRFKDLLGEHVECTHYWYSFTKTVQYRRTKGINSEYVFPAFTVAELGVMLGDVSEGKYVPFYDGKDGNWQRMDSSLKFHEYYTEAQARAASLIYILEGGKITPEECNKRLQEA